MKQLSGPDAMYLYTESDGFPMHIGGVSIYDQSTTPGGKVRFKDILAMFESRLDRRGIEYTPRVDRHERRSWEDPQGHARTGSEARRERVR